MKLKSYGLILPLRLLSSSAGAGAATSATASGPGALALAALVAGCSPTLTSAQKHEMASLLDAQAVAPTTGTISVRADSVVCRASNVDIASRSCTLTFGAKTVIVKGRLANELGATIGATGVSSQGAAGTIYIGVTHLSCAIDPKAIGKKDGSGASCTYQPYQ